MPLIRSSSLDFLAALLADANLLVAVHIEADAHALAALGAEELHLVDADRDLTLDDAGGIVLLARLDMAGRNID